MSLLSFYLRSIIQLIRLIIVLALLFTYHEVYEHYNLDNNLSHFLNFNNKYIDSFNYTLSYIIQFINYWLYECIHFIGLFCVQFSAFSLILFNLISFLYLQNLSNSLESYAKTLNLFKKNNCRCLQQTVLIIIGITICRSLKILLD